MTPTTSAQRERALIWACSHCKSNLWHLLLNGTIKCAKCGAECLGLKVKG